MQTVFKTQNVRCVDRFNWLHFDCASTNLSHVFFHFFKESVNKRINSINSLPFSSIACTISSPNPIITSGESDLSDRFVIFFWLFVLLSLKKFRRKIQSVRWIGGNNSASSWILNSLFLTHNFFLWSWNRYIWIECVIRFVCVVHSENEKNVASFRWQIHYLRCFHIDLKVHRFPKLLHAPWKYCIFIGRWPFKNTWTTCMRFIFGVLSSRYSAENFDRCGKIQQIFMTY